MRAQPSPIRIGTRTIDADAPVFVIAEMSANHGQDRARALEIVDAAADAGADAIKLQTFRPDTITMRSERSDFMIATGTVWDGRTLWDLYQEAYLPWELHEEIFERAASRGLVCFSAPFDASAIEFLEGLDAPAYKIASYEITDIPLIRQAAATGKPIIISSGIARRSDLELAVEACHAEGNDQIVLLKCTSAYPADVRDANLATMVDMGRSFGVHVGLSDHTLPRDVAIAAVALGARVVEKHLTLSRALGGPDCGFSLEPSEFEALVTGIRNASAALGAITYELTDARRRAREHCRSLYVVRDIEDGERITSENVRSIRPGYGLEPRYLERILGRRTRRRVQAGTPMAWELLAEENDE